MKIFAFAAAAMFASAGALAQTPATDAPAADATVTMIHADSDRVFVDGLAVGKDSSANLKPGSVVNTNSGQATVQFSNGCTAHIKGRYVVPAVAPQCAPVAAAAVAAPVGTAAPVGLSPGVIAGVAGAVVVAAAAGGGGGGGNDQPSSP